MARRGKAKRAAPHGLDRLWAPWRMPYIRGASAPSSCLFCALRRPREDRAHLVLARRPAALLMLNRFPYNPAHLMIAVVRHVARFQDLAPEERGDVLDLTALAERALEREYRPHGMNVGANLGHVAGAGFPGHLHLHIVPRWEGDTNYMPVIGETRVLPESLARTWSRLKIAIREIEAGATRRRKG
ncbi:MAG TPA: HIT domain-containing protein [Candidatus Udaeobacter sp.]|jgi:ATP adenylyltransferase|nr:HIT domain-containing protein [Candidatus Udaeobacter sp.]